MVKTTSPTADLVSGKGLYMTKDRRITVAVLMGGVSSEREVSLHSGQGVVNALRAAGFEVIPCVLDTADISCLDASGADVAFIALHGEFGEDGRIQALLEEAAIPYIGSGPRASADALDKLITKHKFLAAGVPTAPFLVFDHAPDAAETKSVFDKLGPRVVVKPVAQGSSIGVSIVSRDGFADAAEDAIRFDGRIIIEPFIKGREFTVGVIGDEALPIIELKPHRDFFDYTAKYQYGETDYIVNPDLPAGVAENITKAALDAFHCLACRDLARIDIMIDEAGDCFVLEANTIPGFTETSLVPMAAKAVGCDFPQLCRRLVEMALEHCTAASSPGSAD